MLNIKGNEMSDQKQDLCPFCKEPMADVNPLFFWCENTRCQVFCIDRKGSSTQKRD